MMERGNNDHFIMAEKALTLTNLERQIRDADDRRGDRDSGKSEDARGAVLVAKLNYDRKTNSCKPAIREHAYTVLFFGVGQSLP